MKKPRIAKMNRNALTTAEIVVSAAIRLDLAEIESFYVFRFKSLERMILTQSEDMLSVSCICKFAKRQQLYLHTVSETINGKPVQAEFKKFSTQHLMGEFDRSWKKARAERSNPKVKIWSSEEYQKKSDLQQLAELEDHNAALLELWNKDPKKAIGTGLSANQKNLKIIKQVMHAVSLPDFE